MVAGMEQPPPERQINGDKLIEKLKQQVANLSFDVALKDTIIEDQDAQIHSLLHQIDELSPTEEITDAPGTEAT